MAATREQGSSAEKLVGFSDSLAAATSLAELQQVFMDAVPRLLPARSFAIYLLDPRKGTPVSRATEGASDVFLARYEEVGRHSDPLLQHCLTTRRAAHSSRLMGEQAWVTHPVYREVMALHGWRMVLEAPVVAGSSLLGTLNFADRDGSILVSDEDLAMASALGRVIGLAAAGFLERESLRRERDHLAAAFDLTDDPLILTDHRTGRRLLNAAARAELDRIAPEAPREWLENAMAAARPDGRGDTTTFTGPGDPGGVDARLRNVRVSGEPELSVSVLRADRAPDGPVDLPASVAALLSPREREVARLAVAGLRDDQIAAKVFLSRYTVKQHLRSVYRKLGLDSRIALTRLVLNQP